MPLSFGRFLLGCLIVSVVLGSVGWAAVRLRSVLVPWSGAPARLVESVVGLAIITGTSLVLGGLRLFSGWPLVLGFLGVSVIVAVGAGRRPASEPRSVLGVEPRPSRLVERVVAVGAVAVVSAQWVSHTAWALGHGMTEGDTLWYHGVFAARFVQAGRLDIFPDLGAAAQGYFPANSQMLHAVAFFPFDRDLLSPVLNLVFGGLALLAAYCVGRRRGLGAICVTAGATVMGLPAIVGTHPGQATNDLVCAAFLLVAIALLIEGGLEPVPISLAAVAAALALGTKLTVAFPLTVLTVAIIGIAIRRRRGALVLVWVIPLVAFGAFWFVRNWALVDNPLPWYDLRLGPFHLPVRARLLDNASIADHLAEGRVWSEIWRPGLRLAFGPFWPLFVAAPGVAGLLMIGRGRATAERVVGAVAVASGLGYVLMPFTMELGGAIFAETARYASPAILLGFVVLPLAVRLDRIGAGWRITASVAALTIVVVNTGVADVDRFAPWRPDDRLLALAFVALALFLVGLARLGGRPARLILTVPVLLALVLGGFVVQRHYLEHRYTVGAGLRLDHFNESLSRKEPTRVAPFDTVQFYPFFGPSFANTVIVTNPPPVSTSVRDLVGRCHDWERVLAPRRPRYVLYAKVGVPLETPAEVWIARSPSVRVADRDGVSTLYRVRGPLRFACPAG